MCATFDLHDFLAVVIGPGRLPWSFGLAGRERGERDREPFIGSSTHETIAGHAVSQCLLVVATHHPLYQLHPTPAAGLRRGPDRVDQAPWESPRDGDEAGELCIVDAERRHDDLPLEATILKRGGISCPLNEGQILTLAVLFALCHHQVFVAEVTDYGPRGMAKFGKRTDATMAIGDLKPSWTGRVRAKQDRNQLTIGANRFDESGVLLVDARHAIRNDRGVDQSWIDFNDGLTGGELFSQRLSCIAFRGQHLELAAHGADCPPRSKSWLDRSPIFPCLTCPP